MNTTLDTDAVAGAASGLAQISLHGPFAEMAALLLLCAGVGAVFVRLRQPVLIAYIVVGILVGPAVYGMVQAHDQGDLLATMTAGAYGAVQAGSYNTRPLVPEVLVKGGKWALVRPRQTYEELIGADHLASWQGGPKT